MRSGAGVDNLESNFVCMIRRRTLRDAARQLSAQYLLDDKWPGFLEFVGRSLAGLFLLALFIIAVSDPGGDPYR